MHNLIATKFNAFAILIIVCYRINCLHAFSKRYYQMSAYDSNKNVAQDKSQQIMDRFRININTIIRTHDSRTLGAKYLNDSEFQTNEECMSWCWQTSPCNLAVFEEKTRGSCYLFDCGSNEDFKCKFTEHNFYTSSILQLNRHPYDLSQWSSQVQHEKELTKLRTKPIGTESTVTPLVVSTSYSSASLAIPTIISTTTLNSLSFKKSLHCQHYQFECRNNSECIAIYNVCDGIPQCSDGSDEANDLECHKSRFNVPNSNPNPFQTHNNQLTFNSNKEMNNRKIDSKSSDIKPQTSISNYQIHDSRHPISTQFQSPQSYYYPKTSDIDRSQGIPKKFDFTQSGGDLANKNAYNTQYHNNGWNQYYQPNEAYNGADNRLSNGYLIDPNEYINSYSNHDTNANSGSYWPPTGRQPSYDTSDQLTSQGRQAFVSNKPQNMDEITQTNDRYSNFYDQILRSGPSNNKLEKAANPISMETSNTNVNAAKAAQSQTQSQTQSQPQSQSQSQSAPITKQGSDIQKYDQLKLQYKEKENLKQQTSNDQHSDYSSLVSSKRFVNGPNIVAVSYMHDSSQQNGRETNSAVIALSLGLCVTILLIVLVGCRMKSFKRKIARKGRTLAHDADYLVNGMYL